MELSAVADLSSRRFIAYLLSPHVRMRFSAILHEFADDIPDIDTEFDIDVIKIPEIRSTSYCTYVQTTVPTTMSWTFVTTVRGGPDADVLTVEHAIFHGSIYSFEDVSGASPHWITAQWHFDRTRFGKTLHPNPKCDASAHLAAEDGTTIVVAPFLVDGHPHSAVLRYDAVSKGTLSVHVGDYRKNIRTFKSSSIDAPVYDVGPWWQMPPPRPAA